MTDAELVERALEGDTCAFGELVERHQRAVYRAALAALGQSAEADDAAQEAWITAHRRLATFRGEASFRTWVLTIAWRKALDRRRSLGRWVRQLVLEDVDLQSPDGKAASVQPAGAGLVAVSPERAVLEAEQVHVARRIITALPRKLRDPLLLVGTGETTYEEVARMLSVPVGTVKWRVSEARRLLKIKLARLGY